MKKQRSYLDKEIEQDIRVRLYFDSILSELIYCDDFERSEREFIKSYLKNGDCFIDVGANIGLFSLIAANTVGPEGKVYGFEPSRKIFQRYLDNININDLSNIFPHRVALSNEENEKVFYNVNDGYDAWSSLACPSSEKKFQCETVICQTWDNFARKEMLIGKPDLMKIDIEGWENIFIKGAWGSLSRDDAPALLIEFSDTMAENAGQSCRDLYLNLVSLGYKIYRYNWKTNQITNETLRQNYPYDNLICVKNENLLLNRLCSSKIH